MGVYVTGSGSLRISGTGSTRVNNFGNIVTNGLVLMYDAAKSISYPKSGTTWFDCTCNGYHATLINGNSSNTGRFSNDNFGGYITTNSQGYGYTNTIRPYLAVNATGSYFRAFGSAQGLYFGSQSFTVEYWFRKYRGTGGFNWSGSGTDPNLGGIDNPFALNDIWGPNKWDSGRQEWCLFIGNGEPTRPLHNPGRGDNFALWLYSAGSIYRTRQYEAMGNSAILINTWYQLVGMRDGSNLKLYLNGTLIENMDLYRSLSSPTLFTNFTSSTVIDNSGDDLRINNSRANNWYTKADNAIVRLYNRALTDEEVQRNFDACKDRYGISKYTIATDGIYVTDSLVLNLDAGNTQSYSGYGFTWSDISGVNNHARSKYQAHEGPGTGNKYEDQLVNTFRSIVITAAPYANIHDFVQYFPPCGNFHRGLFRCHMINYNNTSLHGGGTFEISNPSMVNFGTGSFSVEYWFRKLASSTSGQISGNYVRQWGNLYGVSRWTPTSNINSSWLITVGNFNTGIGDSVSLWLAVGASSYFTTPVSINLSVWYQVIGTRDGNKLRLYLNGSKIREETPVGFATSSSINSSSKPVKISAADYDLGIGATSDFRVPSNLDSSIVRIYNKALSDAEVLQNWNAHKARFGY